MEKIKNFFGKNLEDMVSLDLRALGFFRIFLGSILLIDFLDRLKDVAIFYTDGGVGVNSNNGTILTGTSFSLNFLNGSQEFQILILIIGVVLSLILIFGFRTRITTILVWIILVSVQNRNSIILQGGDDYIRVLLFWSMLLPLGYRFSYDYFRNKSKYAKFDNKYFSPANIGILFQVIFVYYFSAMSKSSPIWNSDFTAIYYSLNLDIFVTWLGRILLTLKPLLNPLTAFVYYLEREVGILLLFPAWNWIARAIGIILIILLHLGIGTTLDVGPFPWIAICGALALMPTEAIDFSLRKIKINKRAKKIIKLLKLKNLKNNLERLIPEKTSRKSNLLPQRLNNYVFFIGTIIIAFFTLSVTFVSYIWNSDNNGANIILSEEIRQPFLFLRMDQNWAMFAPYPFTDDGWYVILGHTFTGQTISMFGSNTKTNFDGFPDNYSQDFKNERWRKFMNNLYNDRYSQLRITLMNFMCREWNDNPLNTDKIGYIEMHYMLQRTPPPDTDPAPLQNLDFGTVSCST